MATAEVYKCLVGPTPGFTVVVEGESPVPLSVLNQWASTTEGLRPESGEWLLRIARFRHDDQVWTWIGYYRHAYQLGGTRPGGVAAAGLLVRGGYVQGAAAVRFLTEAESLLESRAMENGHFVRPLEELEPFPWPLAGEDLPDAALRVPDALAGLDPDRSEKIYIDLSDPGESTLASWYVEWAQIGPAFADYSRLFIGATRRLADAALGISDVASYTSAELASAPVAVAHREAEPEAEPAALLEEPLSEQSYSGLGSQTTMGGYDHHRSEPTHDDFSRVDYFGPPASRHHRTPSSDRPTQPGLDERLDRLEELVDSLARRVRSSGPGTTGPQYHAMLLGAGSTFVGILLLLGVLAWAAPAIQAAGLFGNSQASSAGKESSADSTDEEKLASADLSATSPDAATAPSVDMQAAETVRALFTALGTGNVAAARERWSPRGRGKDFDQFVEWREQFQRMQIEIGGPNPLPKDGQIEQAQLRISISATRDDGTPAPAGATVLLRRDPRQAPPRWFVGSFVPDPERAALAVED